MAFTYFFGDYHVDSAGRRLWRGDQEVPIAGKAFDCIVYLVQHRDRAVGRDELISAVWGALDTSDNVLGQTILLARKALNDTGREQLAIRTVPRFGYQWVLAPASSDGFPVPATGGAMIAPQAAAQVLEARPAPPRDGGTSVPLRRNWRSLRVSLAGLVLMVVCAGWIAIYGRGVGPAAPSHGTGPTLVLPVTIASTDEPVGWMRLGVMDLIAEKLRAAGMSVVPSDNVVAFIHREPRVDEFKALASTLNAGLVISTHVEQIGGSWRVRIQTYGREPPVSVTAQSDDVLDAATQAAQRLAFGLGLVAAPDPAPSGDREQQMLVKRLDAALLSGSLDEAWRLLATASPELKSRGQVQLRAARLYYQRGDFDQAQNYFTALEATTASEVDDTLRARAFTGRGAVYLARNDFRHAFDAFDSAVKLLSDDSSPWLGNALNGRAASFAAQRMYEPALADFARARAILEQSGDSLALATLDSNLASLAMSRDDLHEAGQAFERVGERFRMYSAPAFELDARINAMQVHLLLLDLSAARDDGARIAELLPTEANPLRRKRGELAQYELLRQIGALSNADALLARIKVEADTLRNEELSNDIDLVDGERQIGIGQDVEALRLAERADRRGDDPNDPRGRARRAWLLVRARIAVGDLEGADAARRALDLWATDEKLPVARLYASLAAVRISDARGDGAQANRALVNALDAADAEHVPSDLVSAVIVAVDHDIAALDTSRLAALAQRIGPWAAADRDASLAQSRAYRTLGWTAASQAALARANALTSADKSP